MMERKMSQHQILHAKGHEAYRLGIFVNGASGKLFYGETNLTEENRIIPDYVYLDQDGCIRVEFKINDDEDYDPKPVSREDIDRAHAVFNSVTLVDTRANDTIWDDG